MDYTFEREMSISHSDFLRILPKALASHTFQQINNVITVTLGQGEITIVLSEEGSRQIASLSLPVTVVAFQVKDVAESTKSNFFEQFDRAFQRGGG
jgi:hypothetical protein